MEPWKTNWIDIAEFRENERQKQEEQRKLQEGIEAFRGNVREFFNVDMRAEYRDKAKQTEEKEQRRLEERRQEEERMKKEMQDEEDKKEQERRKEKQDEEEQSQSLFAIHAAIAKSEQITGHTMTSEAPIGFPLKKKKR